MGSRRVFGRQEQRPSRAVRSDDAASRPFRARQLAAGQNRRFRPSAGDLRSSPNSDQEAFIGRCLLSADCRHSSSSPYDGRSSGCGRWHQFDCLSGPGFSCWTKVLSALNFSASRSPMAKRLSGLATWKSSASAAARLPRRLREVPIFVGRRPVPASRSAGPAKSHRFAWTAANSVPDLSQARRPGYRPSARHPRPA